MVAVGAPAYGDKDETDVGPTTSGFYAHVLDAEPGSTIPVSSGEGNPDPIVSTVAEPVCSVGGAQTCAQTDVCDNGEPMTSTIYVTASGVLISGGDNCPDGPDEAAEPEVTPGMVAAAFRRIPLPASELDVQPPGGRTLVNFDTNFYTEGGEFTRTVTLLGRRVELRIWPSRFGWRFGDGRSTWTTTPGAKYPDLEITHRYLEKGRVAPSVDTTYAAQFRVGTGPWRDVVGTVTIPGTPESLRVVTARPVLVGG
ncbi:hypothetical protein GCM10027062_08570 [Nocardioides hungaricus]